MKKPWTEHLMSSKDLVTTHAAIRAGFVSLALEKNRFATPFVEKARTLKAIASKAKTPRDLLGMEKIRPEMLAAAGISDKAAVHLNERDKENALRSLIGNFLEPAGSDFVEELVFRFLLTRGDTLGGSMRNLGGTLAQRKLTRSLISCLKLAGRSYTWLHSETKAWAEAPPDDADADLYLRGLSWENGRGLRTMMYNLRSPLVKGAVDMSLFDCDPKTISRQVYEMAEAYIALGELKGGIDPAGADEHWKTGWTAVTRISEAFAKFRKKPRIFFIGAAIEARMASEIWELLERGVLDNAANLTDDRQLASISRWLCSL
ncbi:MAG: type II restriction endonuclease [Planctomycetota bacterium]|nr:type II restriction endonuclease [Planctomycetota bacterium]